jgi:hypothetical protein
MNEIERVRALLLRGFPTAIETLIGPTKGDYWLLDMKHGEIAIVVVWRGGGAFHVAIEHDRDTAPAPSETRASVEEVVALAVDGVSAMETK